MILHCASKLDTQCEVLKKVVMLISLFKVVILANSSIFGLEPVFKVWLESILIMYLVVNQ